MGERRLCNPEVILKKPFFFNDEIFHLARIVLGHTWKTQTKLTLEMLAATTAKKKIDLQLYEKNFPETSILVLRLWNYLKFKSEKEIVEKKNFAYVSVFRKIK